MNEPLTAFDEPQQTEPAGLQPAAPPVMPAKSEWITALLAYVIGYFYIYTMTDPEIRLKTVLLLGVFIVGCGEWLLRDRKRAPESWVWLGCLAVSCVSRAFRISAVWTADQLYLFAHIFAVWWVLSRSGLLLDGVSGHFLPLDALRGFVTLPFGNFFLRIRTLAQCIRCRVTSGKKKDRTASLWTLGAAVICAILFAAAIKLLRAADSGFGSWLGRIRLDFLPELPQDFLFNFFLGLPVGAYLFGLLAGSRRYPQEKLMQEKHRAFLFLQKLHRVPAGFWTFVILLFSVVYIAFIGLQGSYLFGAYSRTLPEGFTVARYAREGFFELCKVMAVNFALLWLVTRLVSEGDRMKATFKAACLLLLAESMLFAVIAMSKLGLYISCFGFTPLRLQSSWLVFVLFSGAVLWCVSLCSGKKTFRLWMYIGAVSLSLLTLVPELG